MDVWHVDSVLTARPPARCGGRAVRDQGVTQYERQGRGAVWTVAGPRIVGRSGRISVSTVRPLSCAVAVRLRASRRAGTAVSKQAGSVHGAP